MQINKKILFIALSMSLHSAIISMEQTLKEHAKNLEHYMSDKNSELRKQNILPFAQWITEKRATFSVDNN